MAVVRSDLQSIGKQDKGGGLPPLTVVCSYTEGMSNLGKTTEELSVVMLIGSVISKERFRVYLFH